MEIVLNTEAFERNNAELLDEFFNKLKSSQSRIGLKSMAGFMTKYDEVEKRSSAFFAARTHTSKEHRQNHLKFFKSNLDNISDYFRYELAKLEKDGLLNKREKNKIKFPTLTIVDDVEKGILAYRVSIEGKIADLNSSSAIAVCLLLKLVSDKMPSLRTVLLIEDLVVA